MNFPVPIGRAAVLTAAFFLTAGCSSSDSPTEPDPLPPLGLSVTALGATRVRVSFNASAGNDSYHLERAEGAAGTFAAIATIPAPAGAGVVTYTDSTLRPETEYRYRVAAQRGTRRSAFSAPQSVTTLPFGSFVKEVTGDITSNTTWYADTTYLLKGFIHVANGATLTIQPGTIIKGDFNTLGSSLFVLRGAKIVAVGRADAPIVFTSSRPPGQRQPGDWGGLIIVGNATINRSGVEVELEGTGTASGGGSGTNYRVVYSGGTTDSDDSGELRYVRVEFAGFAPSLNNELNSFTFAAVGSGTRLSYLQALAGLDDSFEWFGGTVDAKYLVSYESGDDHFDMAEGYRGRVQYAIALQSARLEPRTGAGSPSSDPQGVENDGCEGAGCQNGRNSTPLTTPLLANFTLVGMGDVALAGSSGGYGMMLRRGTGGWYVNGIVARWPRAAISLRDPETYARAGSLAVPDLGSSDLAVRNVLLVENGAPFQTGSNQFAFDLAGNAIEPVQASTASLFLAFPTSIGSGTTAAAFDWTPAAGSAAANGGLTTFTGKLAQAAGTFIAGSNYRGAAAPNGPKWWQGWTTYYQR
jgi:hypothetical protein